MTIREILEKVYVDGQISGAKSTAGTNYKDTAEGLADIIKILEVEKKVAWYCPVCHKFDLADIKEQLAKPEHISYRGIDLGNCKGKMIPLVSLDDMIGKCK